MPSTLWIKSLCIILALWWVYLFWTTQPIIVFDAEGYEQTGHLIFSQGWHAFFHAGPQREPMFGALVALSMQLGQWAHIPYTYPLKLIGILFLCLTLLFSYRLMRMLAISPWVAAAACFYLGLSPTMTNSSLRVWSEFAAYPWVVLAVIWAIKSWRAMAHWPDNRRGFLSAAGHGLMVGLMFLLVMAVKATTEGVLLCYLWPFYGAMIHHWRRGHFLKARQLLVFCLVLLAFFEGAVNAYRWTNYTANGHFTYTTRGDWALYGNTVRRVEPLTLTRFAAAVASVPNLGLCPAIVPNEDCAVWTARYSDDIIDRKRDELNAQGLTEKAESQYFIQHSLQMILTHPFQEIILGMIEAHKMFFWESSASFMAYPDWLQNAMYAPAFVISLQMILGVLTWAAFVFAFCWVCRRRDDDLLWVVNFIFWYMAVYALYFIVDRYAFPIVPLYTVLIAFACQKIAEGLMSGRFSRLWQRGLSMAGKSIVVVALIGALSLFTLNPLGKLSGEHAAVEQKAKWMTLAYDYPFLMYFARIVAGLDEPAPELMEGYRFGRPYIFKTYYQKAVDLFPDSDAAHYLLGFCEYYLGNSPKAAMEFEKSLKLNPRFFWSYYNLATIYAQEGQLPKSKELIRQASLLNMQENLDILRQDYFYRQIWSYTSNPQLMLEDNLKKVDFNHMRVRLF